MCSPLIFGAVISAAASIGGIIMQQNAAAAAARRRAAAQREAAAYQAAKRKEFIRRDEELQRRQQQEQNVTLQRIGEAPGEREEEESRLTSEFEEPVQQSVEQAQTENDALISGTAETGRVIQSTLGRELNSAASDARNRVAALATLQSYGPSQFGLTNNLANIFRDTGANIDLVNQMRRGERGWYNMARSIGAADAPAGGGGFGAAAGPALTTVGSYGLGATIGKSGAGSKISSTFGGGIS